jgi:hypothetical protein
MHVNTLAIDCTLKLRTPRQDAFMQAPSPGPAQTHALFYEIDDVNRLHIHV